MLLSLAGALAAATILVLAAHAARERRALSEDVQALRAEVLRLTRALEARATASTPEASARAGTRQAAAERATAMNDDAVQARGSRTLH